MAVLCAWAVFRGWRTSAGADAREARMRAARRGAKTVFGLLGVIAAGLALWAAVNFDGLFITFHRLAFRNDLWLLNPRTDLLIRLMPETLFIRLGLMGLAVFSAGMAVVVLAMMGWSRTERRKRNS